MFIRQIQIKNSSSVSPKAKPNYDALQAAIQPLTEIIGSEAALSIITVTAEIRENICAAAVGLAAQLVDLRKSDIVYDRYLPVLAKAFSDVEAAAFIQIAKSPARVQFARMIRRSYGYAPDAHLTYVGQQMEAILQKIHAVTTDIPMAA